MTEESLSKIVIENEEFALREWDFERDHESVSSLLEVVFENELQMKGLEVKNIFDEFKSLLPFLKFMGIFSKNFKHVLDGFVIENKDDKIISSVNVGYSLDDKYEISMVATHPDYRRKGFARRLVTQAVEHSKNLGAKMCILEVLDINEPAYKLYRSLDFAHYDTITRQKLEPDQLSSVKQVKFPKEYQLQELERNKKTSKQRYELDLKSTPKEVQLFHPVQKSKYFRPLLIRIIRPIARLILKPKTKTWTIHRDSNLVGTIYVNLSKKEGTPNRLDLMIDPKHNAKLIEPMLTYAMEFIKENLIVEQNVIIEFRTVDEIQKAICEKYGFIIVETLHLLGLKLQ
ncbi:MAG: GNAT family N-acetyltransferase [Candidatus Heimdallarchaeota archaeon]|nr:GNAT family N-acetyltransferase [Candidatus Heimdallarchaeota archaeon]MCK4770424.1 GNAT family N-acetyltransferase [Candidatus Heimdallarchaeota archaeon]